MAAVIVQVADSDYGSDIPIPALSDYGSDIDLDDVEEDATLGTLLVRLAASASVQVTYPRTEKIAQTDHVVSGSGLQATHQEDRAVQSYPLVARSPRLEIEYDAPSRRAFSGTFRSPCGIKHCALPI